MRNILITGANRGIGFELTQLFAAQAGTKATTLGTILTLIGVGVMHPEWLPKILLIIVFIVITNPVGSSTLIRSAYRSGVKSHTEPVVDELGPYYDKEVE